MNTDLIQNMPYQIAGRFVLFQLCSIEPITEAAALAYQNKQGYSPMGYGFYKFKCEMRMAEDGNHYFQASWQCSSSCE